MANTFKLIRNTDVAAAKTQLHEAIPITGSIVSGTYSDNNIKTYAHGMFESVYDYPYLSSSANHIFDLTFGSDPVTLDSLSLTLSSQNQKKRNIYQEFAQVLVGYDVTGTIRQIDVDGVLGTGSIMDSIVAIPFSRLLTKDEIKKESFSLILGASSTYASPFGSRIKIFDSGALNSYKINSPAGEYGLLYATNSEGSPINGENIQAGGDDAQPVGLLYYQAGVAILNLKAVFSSSATAVNGILSESAVYNVGGDDAPAALFSDDIDTMADNFRKRVYDISFNNTVELNSTIYFCRADHNEFNYSANPTYLSSSQIRVKNNSTDTPVSYFTTVGLYSADNELLAVAKLSEPLRKDPTQNYTIRVRLDY
jgi:hypothetical protein